MNVALTRAKYGVVILGNPKVLSKASIPFESPCYDPPLTHVPSCSTRYGTIC
ncbi:hypothetical protein DENSPDRAFT_834843 [Dentipellis sp. KUC8613]|nr:hypothetical protein DENSPDRAFT_834843 [Dentipellis sp. KUC8613]